MPQRKSKHPSFLWILDQWSSLDVANDTTLLLARAAQELGYVSDLAQVSDLRLAAESGKIQVFAQVFQLTPYDNRTENHRADVNLANYTQIHYRVDPPVDAHFADPLKMLMMAKLPVVNAPATLLGHSEKLLPLLESGLAPTSSVVSSPEMLAELRKKQPFSQKSLVIKPLFTAQSQGVQLLHANQRPPQTTYPILLQPYLPEIRTEGELRTWWAEGQCVGALRKYPLDNDFRVLVDQGSRVEAVKAIPKSVRNQFPKIRKLLREQNIKLAAVDWIGAQVSDFNFTSPGLLVQLERTSGLPISKKIISLLARNLKSAKPITFRKRK